MIHRRIVCTLLGKHCIVSGENQEKINQSNFSNESFYDINPIITSVLKYPTIQRNAKPKKSKSSDLPKRMTTEQALIILKWKEDKKYHLEIVKEAKRQKREHNINIKNNKKALPKTQGSIQAKKPVRQSKRPHKKSRRVLENEDISSEEEIIEEETSEEVCSTSDSEESDSSYDDEKNIWMQCKKRCEGGKSWIKCDFCFKWFRINCTNQRKSSLSSNKKLKSWKYIYCS